MSQPLVFTDAAQILLAGGNVNLALAVRLELPGETLNLALGNGSIVTNDGTPGIEWRQEAGWGYSGIAAATPIPDSGDTKSSGRSGTHRKNTIRSSTYRSGTTR